VWVHGTEDWGLLKADNPVTGVVGLKVQCNEPKVDDAIYTIGNPAILDFIKTTGLVAGFAEELKDGGKVFWRHVVITNLNVTGGNSGGPVFNNHDEVWGNLVGGLRGTTFSIVEPIGKICDLLPDL
jgi:S1-C subfamily serine protease